MSAWMRIGFIGIAASTFVGQSLAADTKAAQRIAYTNKPLVSVPIRISEADRTRVKSIKFYVKTPGNAWKLQESGGPRTERFNFQAPGDGEFSFSFPTEEETRSTPIQADNLTAAITVVVDSKAPELLVQPLVVASGQTYVHCTMRDTNADPGSLTAEFELPDGTWKSLAPYSKDTPGMYRSLDGTLPSKIRVTGKDKAGNVSTQMVALAPSSPAPETATAMSSPKAEMLPPVPTPIVSEPAAPAAVVPVISEKPTPTMTLPEPRVTEKPSTPMPEAEKPSMPQPVMPASSSAPVARQIMSANRCSLAYALDNLAGQSLQRVEAYVTRDEGKTWARMSEDQDKTSPIDLAFADDGLYGVLLVVTTNTQPALPPSAGEQPDWWIEIDTGLPEIKLDSTTLGTNEDAGLLILNWNVRDRNLAPDSVEVSWSHQADGPWRSIAKGLRSDSQYRWIIPREVGSKAFLKIEAVDRAGNVGRFVTPQPVATELTRPKARVIGINPAAVRP